MIDGCSGRGRHADAEVAEEQHIQRHHAGRRSGEKHTDHGGEHDQGHDLELA
jgi:hypothetical protein